MAGPSRQANTKATPSRFKMCLKPLARTPAEKSTTRNLKNSNAPLAPAPAPAAGSSPPTPWRWFANFWASRRWEFPACRLPTQERPTPENSPESWCWTCCVGTPRLRKSSPRVQLKMQLQASRPRGAPRTRFCICWPSLGKPGCPFRLTILTASARGHPSWPISNLEDVLSQQTFMKQAALRSSQSACLKPACSKETPSPSQDERLPKKPQALKKRRDNKSSTAKATQSKKQAA